MITLKGGHQTEDPRLDRVPQFDERSRNFRVRSMSLAGVPLVQRKPRSYTWGINKWLDQGSEGRCVEYSICHDLLGRPKEVQPALVDQILSAKRIYWPAQEADDWPGGSYPGATPTYEGTSVLAGIKVAAALGFYLEYRWAMALDEAVLGLSHVGPLVLGINWYEGMYNTDANGWLHVTGAVAGGHAILAHAIKIAYKPGAGRTFDDVDLDASFITLHNSWGKNWGVEGRGKLSLTDFDRLRREDGEVCIISQRAIPRVLPQ